MTMLCMNLTVLLFRGFSPNVRSRYPQKAEMWSSAMCHGPKTAGPCRRDPAVSGCMTGCLERLLAKSCKNRRVTVPPESPVEVEIREGRAMPSWA